MDCSLKQQQSYTPSSFPRCRTLRHRASLSGSHTLPHKLLFPARDAAFRALARVGKRIENFALSPTLEVRHPYSRAHATALFDRSPELRQSGRLKSGLARCRDRRLRRWEIGSLQPGLTETRGGHQELDEQGMRRLGTGRELRLE